MSRKASYYRMVKGHTKSIVLGGGHVLFPLVHTNIENLTNTLQAFIKDAETHAYERGYADAQSAIRKSLGLS